MTTKEKILQTARLLFNETNTQTATTNHIAKAMNISAGNLHYHYKNREEIIRKLYLQMHEKMSLSIEALPQTIAELNEHQKILMPIQDEYRFFFQEMLFLFSRDAELEGMYIKDNIAHRERITIVIKNFIANEELIPMSDVSLNFLVDSALLSWQFYNSYQHTLGKKLNAKEGLSYSDHAMLPFLNKNSKKA